MTNFMKGFVEDRPLGVLVCGFEQGGTTVLLDLLRGHSCLDSGFEGFLGLYDEPAALKSHSEHLEIFRVRWGLDENGLEAVLAQSNHFEAYKTLRQRATVLRKPRAALIDKTPGYLPELGKVLSRLPGVPAIVLIRDPRGVMASWAKRHDLSIGGLDWHLEQFVLRYNKSLRGLKNLSPGQRNRVHITTYESLCLDPERELRKICHHVGIAYEPKMLDLDSPHAETHEGLVSGKHIFAYRDVFSREKQSEILRATHAAPAEVTPCLSLVMPVCDPKPSHFRKTIESIQAQDHILWDLCISDDASQNPEIREMLDTLEEDPRVDIQRQKRRLGISRNSNQAWRRTVGHYLSLVDHDDVLYPQALSTVLEAARENEADLVYTDEELKIEHRGWVLPYLKPDYSPDFLLSTNYFCHLVTLRRDLAERLGGFDPKYDGAQDYDLVLRAVEVAEKIHHVAEILYIWRRYETSTTGTEAKEDKVLNVARRCVQAALDRRGIRGQVVEGLRPRTLTVRRRIDQKPLVSIVVPFRDRPELLRGCLDSVIRRTSWPNYEIIAVDNGSEDPVVPRLLRKYQRVLGDRFRSIRMDIPFNYGYLNNQAVAMAGGEHVLFLNNDTEVVSSEWIGAMVQHSQREEVGVVGARLTFPDGRIQHAGVIIGFRGVAGHAFLGLPPSRTGYLNKPYMIHNLSAVTGACMMMRREVFLGLGGFNCTELRDDFTDVDLCLRAREQGLLVVYTPYAHLYHLQSASRKLNEGEAHRAVIEFIRVRHQQIFRDGDPYYNPNFSLEMDHISQVVEQLRIGQVYEGTPH